MDLLYDWIAYLQDNPSMGFAMALGLGAIYFLLNRRPKLMREADHRFNQLRDERGNYYRNLRPPS